MQQQGRTEYMTVISALGKGKQPQKAMEVFEKMQQQRVRLNMDPYNTLISALAKGNQSEQAHQTFGVVL